MCIRTPCGSQTLMEVDLSKAVSAQDVYDAVASAEPSGDWIIASGFVASSLGGQTLELSELDRAAAGRPLLSNTTLVMLIPLIPCTRIGGN